MTIRSWLERLIGRRAVEPPADDPFSRVRWVPADDSEFGVEYLDCQSVTGSLLAVTQSAEIADSFTRLRGSNGADLRGRTPEDSKACSCDLHYPHKGEPGDGPLFKAEQMEDKWDIYLYDGHLYFTRSWTGDLEYRAKILFREGEAAVGEIEAGAASVENDPAYPIALVDFLIRSHLYRMPILHPFPKSAGRDPRQLAWFSFIAFGRHGRWGTFADTTRLDPPTSMGNDR